MNNAEFNYNLSPILEDFLQAYRQDETKAVKKLIATARFTSDEISKIQDRAKKLVKGTRERRLKKGGLDALLFQYDLSSEEGIVLMCLAEALLRIPDAKTSSTLIKDKFTAADFKAHLGKSHSSFVNAATWGMMLTGKILKGPATDAKNLTNTFSKLINRGGEPLIRQAVGQTMKILGKQFVMGRTINEALKRAKSNEEKGYTYSYDMLGEAARTKDDAAKYYKSYETAIEEIGKNAGNLGPIKGPGISVKLSALHPRYSYAKRLRMLQELLPKVKQLAISAKKYNLGFTIDAEEADRLEISLEIIKELIVSPELKGWDGFGLAVQAYQKRAPYVIDHLAALCRANEMKIMVRLVKGAYWDSEIKKTQELGLSDYPVFTRKILTDVSYIACAKKLFGYTDVIYPQFATHNAYTLSGILHIANDYKNYEFQCLHGMGDSLYDQIIDDKNIDIPCRIYAPVGTHEDLLSYLVRRLLENGANSSFVNRIADENMDIEDLVQDPTVQAELLSTIPHPKIPLPVNMYGAYRGNSVGLDLSNCLEFNPMLQAAEKFSEHDFVAKCLLDKRDSGYSDIKSPQDNSKVVGKVLAASEEVIASAIYNANQAHNAWNDLPVEKRANILLKMAKLLETNSAELIYLLNKEAGKTLNDCIGEIREAVDFCYYYAAQAPSVLVKKDLPGPTGESNIFSYHGRGVIVCISPWNFPLAIFLGQITAALVAGNCVIAKPAEQTPLIAQKAISLLHEAGVPKEVCQLVPGGREVGAALTKNIDINGVMFTGSTLAAQKINQALAMRDAGIIPLVAETGGQNAMLVDSSALLEQVTDDVINSAFLSAGQRCSALRVLYVQADIADKLIKMITGAMQEIEVGLPHLLSTDVGPVIDKAAKEKLLAHIEDMKTKYKLLQQVQIADEINKHGTFVPPTAFEIDNINALPGEVFGPVLHIIRYNASDIDKIISDINGTGFGLTFGMHSRIDENIKYVTKRIRAGNLYVNRNIVGAVVGVQPFGGEGLSGTGPKAGGPNYLLRLVSEKVTSTNTTAAGGNASLMSLSD